MSSISVRRLVADDIPAVVEMVNRVGCGGPLTPQIWEAMEAQDHVTYLACDDDDVVGALPLTMRDLVISPGLAVRAAFAHMVSVEESHRGAGLGSRLMRESLRALGHTCDMVCVYIGREGRAPYRFYERAGYRDLMYVYRYDALAEYQSDGERVRFYPAGEVRALSSDLLRCFTSCYPRQAGFPFREAGFWHRALRSVIFDQGPKPVGLLALPADGRMEGYALLAREGSLLSIMELATRNADANVARRLLRGARGIAQKEGLERVIIYCSVKYPFVNVLEELGWERGSREVRSSPANAESADVSETHRILCARVLDVKGVAQRSWPDDDDPEGVSLRVWTSSTGPVMLHTSAPNGRSVNLEMKEETLQRLVLRRLHLGQSIEAELVTVQSGTPYDIDVVAQRFSPSPWMYFELDFI